MNKTQELYKMAKKIIPGGTQLLSKRPEMYLPEIWPAYYSKAKGCEVWDLDGNHYYDTCIMGVGSNVLGYAYDEVDTAAKEAIDNGGMCTLNAPEEVKLAEQLIKLHPWASMVRYAKTGGEAMAIAVRIARAFTKKDKVLVCGYHGWHDWYLSANLVKGDPLAGVHLKGLEPLGVPKGLAGTNLIFHYNNIIEFRNLIAEHVDNIAAVVMEPIRNDYPDNGFLEEIREIAIKNNIVLIFDEITAGFRLCAGGSHLKLNIEPDIAVFAKAMTNGYPLAAILGKENVMTTAQDTFISSTFWTERVAFAATLKAIECYQKNKVEDHLEVIGKKIQKQWKKVADQKNIKIHILGIYALCHFEFVSDDALYYKTYFTQEMLKRGFLAATAFYVSYAHTEEILNKYFKAFEEVMQKISDINQSNKNVKLYLEGNVCQAGFERLN